MNPKLSCILSIILLVLISHVLSAQSVGIGTDAPNPNAVLELVSPDNNQGLLIPKMTTAQRNSSSFVSELSTEENGLLVYDTDEATFYYWDEDQWTTLKNNSVGAPQTATEISVVAGAGIEATDVQSALIELQTELLSSETTDAEIAAMGYVKTVGTDDQIAGEVTFTPGGDLTATDVQTALIELDSKVTDAASAAIADGAVTTPKISNGAVTNLKITSVDYAKITNLPANLDTDTTDDFDGDFTSLGNIPVGLADGDNQDISLSGTNLSIDNGSTIDLAGVNTDTQLTDAEIAAMGYVKTGGTDDQVAGEVTFTPGGDLIATDVQAALLELDSKVTDAASTAIADGAVTTPKISNGAVTNVKITSVDYAKITNLPANLDTDATDDFDGDFTSLANIPAELSDGDDDTQLSEAEVDAMVADNGYLTSEVDGSVSNEIQDVSLSGNTLTLTGDGTPVDLSKYLDNTDTNTQLSEAEVDAMVADNGYLTSEVDGSITNEIQDFVVSGDKLGISGGSTVIDLTKYLDDTDTNTQLSEAEVDAMVADNGYLTSEVDGSTTNEIQNLTLSGNTLSLTGDGTPVDLSKYLDNTDTNTQLSETQVDNMVSDNGFVTNTVSKYELKGNTETVPVASRIIEVYTTLSESGIVGFLENIDVLEIVVVNVGSQMIRVYHGYDNILLANKTNFDIQSYTTLHLYYSKTLGVWIQIAD